MQHLAADALLSARIGAFVALKAALAHGGVHRRSDVFVKGFAVHVGSPFEAA